MTIRRWRQRSSWTKTRRVLEIFVLVSKHVRLYVVGELTRARAGPKHEPAASTSAPTQLRELLSDLGPTFIKLGQVLSTRPDLVPPAYEAALSELQDSARVVPVAFIREAIRNELGSEVETLFADFVDVPLASASIGQVHAARLPDGREVVIKVRRPGVEAVIDADLAVLTGLARLLVRIPGPMRRLDLSGFVAEFGDTIHLELNYVTEGHSAERIAQELAPIDVHVPGVLWDFSAGAVLTLERIHGVKIDDFRAITALGIDRGALARTLADAYLSMVFVNGFFQADPHPGNLFVEPDGRLAMVDFGMTGSVSANVRHGLVEILLAIATGDFQRNARALHGLGVIPSNVDQREVAHELEHATGATFGVPLRELRFAPLLAEFMTVSRRRRLKLPRELALLFKTVIMCEGLAAQLDPEFSLAPVLVRFVTTNLGSTD